MLKCVNPISDKVGVNANNVWCGQMPGMLLSVTAKLAAPRRKDRIQYLMQYA